MTLPKPAHLAAEQAAQYTDPAMVAAYQHRPPYPDGCFDVLAGLLPDPPRAILDAGCGRGELARRLVSLAPRVDAVDVSATMIAAGRKLPGGDHPGLCWQVSPIEQAALDPPYDLITTGQSLHWMDWDVTLPLFARLLTPHGWLAVLAREPDNPPWFPALFRLIDRYSTNRDSRPYDLISELADRGLFAPHGERRVGPIAFRQRVDDYIEQCHSRNGFSRARMTASAAAAFDAAVRALVRPFARDGWLELPVVGTVVWGKPLVRE